MRNAIAVISCILFMATICHGQNNRISLGIGLSPLLTGRTEIDMEYTFSSHWAISAGISSIFFREVWNKSTMEYEHDLKFGNTSGFLPDEKPAHNSLNIRYWPSEKWTGPFISHCLRFFSDYRTDYLVGFGYGLPVSCRIRIHMEYAFSLIDRITDKESADEEIRICLYYRFGG